MGAEELGRSNADDGVDDGAELDFLAEDVGVLSESALPPGVADDGYGMIALGVVVGIVQSAADQARERRVCGK